MMQLCEFLILMVPLRAVSVQFITNYFFNEIFSIIFFSYFFQVILKQGLSAFR